MKVRAKGKWVAVIAALTGVSVMALALLGHKVVHTEIVIPASPAEVWSGRLENTHRTNKNID